MVGNKNLISAIILIAGKGRRLNPVTNLFPKCILKINSESILERQVRILSSNNIRRIIFCIGYQKKRIKRIIRLLAVKYGFKEIFVENKRFLNSNTLYSFHLCLKVCTSNFFLLNGDVVFDQNIISKMLKDRTTRTGLMAVQKKEIGDEEVKVIIDNNSDKIIEISKKIPPEKSVGEFIGIAFFPINYLKLLKKVSNKLIRMGNYDEYFEYAIQHTIANYTKKYLMVDILKNRSIEIDTYDDFREAKILFQ